MQHVYSRDFNFSWGKREESWRSAGEKRWSFLKKFKIRSRNKTTRILLERKRKMKRSKHPFDVIFSKVHHNEYRRLPVEGPQSRSIDHCVHYRFLSPVARRFPRASCETLCRCIVVQRCSHSLPLTSSFCLSFPPMPPFFFSLFTEYKFTFGNRGEARTLHSSEHRYTFFCRWSRTDEQA